MPSSTAPTVASPVVPSAHGPLHPPMSTGPASVRPLSRQSLYQLLVQFPAVCFVGALATDLAYAQTQLFTWETFSVWLLAAGCVMAGVTAITALVVIAREPAVRRAPRVGLHAFVGLIVLALSIVNAFVHSRDGYTAVVPTGLTLSAVVVLLMIVVAWLGRSGEPTRVRAGAPA